MDKLIISEKLKIPVWLICLAGVVLIAVVLERLYVAKVPVKIFGIELNQPVVHIPGATLRLLTPVTATAEKNHTRSLGIKESEGFCYVTGVSGKFAGYGEVVKVFVDNGVWTLSVSQGGDGAHITGTAQCVSYVNAQQGIQPDGHASGAPAG